MNTTPRPWIVFGSYVCKMNKGNHPVYVTGRTPGCTANWEADAALIIRAVNTLNEVKVALKAVVNCETYYLDKVQAVLAKLDIK